MKPVQVFGGVLLILAAVGWISQSVDWSDVIPPIVVDPIVTDDPPPLNGDGLGILIVRETSENKDLPESQVGIFTSADLREYIEENSGQMRIYEVTREGPEVLRERIQKDYLEGLEPVCRIRQIFILRGQDTGRTQAAN